VSEGAVGRWLPAGYEQFAPRAAVAVLISGSPVRPAWADYIGTELGAAAGFAVLDISTGGNVSIANAANAGSIVGNVGVAGTTSGNFSDWGTPITGSLYLGGSQTANFSGGVTASGGILNGQSTLLSAAASAATSASTTFSGLTPTQSVAGGQITGTTITAGNQGGLNVINLSNISLGNGQVLTLNGSAGTEFILDDSGGMSLNSAQIVLTGGLTANDVVYNVTGNTVQTSGGLNNESVLAGTILAPNENVQLTPGALTGEIIGGKNISIASGASVSGVHVGAPAPVIGAGLPAFLLLGGGFAFAGWLRRRAGRVQPTAPAGA
jgi:hypothetical protein